MKIAGWMADWSGCGFYRIALPGDALRGRGHEVTVSNNLLSTAVPRDSVRQALSAFTLPELTSQRRELDVIVGQRVNLESTSKIWQEIARHDQRPRLVFEIDDDLFSVDPSSTVAYKYFMQPDVQRRLRGNAAAADTVTVSTAHLGDVMRQHTAARVVVVPNTVPAYLLDTPAPRPRNVVTVGWAGSSTHAMDWVEVNGTVSRVICSNPLVEFHTIGAQYPLSIPLSQYRWTGWSRTVPAYWRTIDFDIGLAPLKNHVFNLSKSPIKALEYASLGIPVIASNVGPYADFVQPGVTGFLCDTLADWRDALETLIRDPELRARMGQAGKDLAKKYTTESWVPVWERAML